MDDRTIGQNGKGKKKKKGQKAQQIEQELQKNVSVGVAYFSNYIFQENPTIAIGKSRPPCLKDIDGLRKKKT